MARTRAHVRYKNKNDKIVPGVTTILSVLNKPALVAWANRLGLQGIDCNKYTDEMATIGTLAHEMIMVHFAEAVSKTVAVNFDEYTQEQIDKAENCLLSFYEWEKAYQIEPILVEEPLVSERYQFGGTIDLYCKISNLYCLIDFKTGKGLYPEMSHQVSAYRQLLLENGHNVDAVRILRIGRSEDEGFEDKRVANCEAHWDIFEHCLAIYNLQKGLK